MRKLLFKLAKLIVGVHKNTHYGLKGFHRSKKAFGLALKRSDVLSNVRIDTFDCKCVRFVTEEKMPPDIQHFWIVGLDRIVKFFVLCIHFCCTQRQNLQFVVVFLSLTSSRKFCFFRLGAGKKFVERKNRFYAITLVSRDTM